KVRHGDARGYDAGRIAASCIEAAFPVAQEHAYPTTEVGHRNVGHAVMAKVTQGHERRLRTGINGRYRLERARAAQQNTDRATSGVDDGEVRNAVEVEVPQRGSRRQAAGGKSTPRIEGAVAIAWEHAHHAHGTRYDQHHALITGKIS